MKVFCLGGAGRICRESVYDLVKHSDFEQITIGDFDLKEAAAVKEWLNDRRVDITQVDVNNISDSVSKMEGYDVVMDGTKISLNGNSTECIAKAGCHGVNLNGFGAEFEWDDLFKKAGKTCIPGFGMTPGITQMMAMKAAEKLDRVDEVFVSHGAFRPIAFSPSITETTIFEYDPELPTRVVFENGKMVQVPPFSRPKRVFLPEPYGKTIQYIIPHAETVTLSQALKEKGVRLIEVRGTWPTQNMSLIRGLYDYGILSNPTININGSEVGLMALIGEYLQTCEQGKTTELYGYALHVEVNGSIAGSKKRAVLTHSHPKSDGSIANWAGLRAYTRNVGIPMAIAAVFLAKGRVKKQGVLIPEAAFSPVEIFKELGKRSIYIHERWENL